MGLISRVSSRTYRKTLHSGPTLSQPSQETKRTATKMSGKQLNFFEDFMLSGVAAGVSKTAAAPIERVKLLVQNQDEMIKQGRLDKPYTGVLDCTKRVLATEGVAPFWRGNLANVLRYFPTQALNFAFKDKVKAMIAVPKDVGYGTKLAGNVASGGIAGSMSLFFVYSLDFARTRLANDNKSKDGTRQYNGLIDVYRKTLATDGIQGIYRGFVISCVGIFIYRGLYFGLYDTIKPMVGWAVTVVSGLCSYPIDTVRRRMMMTSGGGVAYKGSIDCATQVIKNEGFMSLMKGAGANILRGVAGAGVLSGFDVVKAAYIKFRTEA